MESNLQLNGTNGYVNTDQCKDIHLQGIVKLNPVFDDLNDPSTIKNHIEELKRNNEMYVHHEDILNQLLEQVKPVDFEALANPNGIENFKLNNKHFLVISIEQILKLVEKNSWGLCKNQDFIYLYNGAYWAEVDKELFQKFLGEAAEKIGVPEFTAKHFRFREDIYKQFLATAYLSTPNPNRDTVQINLQNGTYEISSHGSGLKPFDRRDFLTYQLPFKYDPQARAPIFQKYLDRVLPDKERQSILAEYMGYLFIKNGNSLKLEVALILYGTGANGKSVFFEIVNALLGRQNTSSYSLQQLTDGPGYYRAMIANKLVNYASEINGKLEADMFKRMVSGEIIDARLPYGNPMQLTQYAKLIFNCNELPRDIEHTPAFFRRWLIVPFDVTIPEDEQDKELHLKIIDNELSGIFNWVLEGLDRLLKQKKFSDCDAARKAIEQYKSESNSVRLFLNENEYKSSLTNYKLVKDLYPEYRSFCIEDGAKPFSKKNFTKQLRLMDIVVDRVSQNQMAAFIE